ncbi:MAG: hypothetical protein Q9218_002492 [Villophora microphyllina]
MATTQQRQPASRMSVGGNILSRMLQLEKASKHNRNTLPDPTTTPTEKPLSMTSTIAAVSALVPVARPVRQNLHAPASPAAVRQSQSVPHPPAVNATTSPNLRSSSPRKPDPIAVPEASSNRPSTMPRSQTLPALSLDLKTTESTKPRRDSKTEMADDENSGSEICQSPSWSDFGGAKRKKEKKRMEKERKEEEKRLKKEEAKRKTEELKASKRLSKKPPPAAMETQRLPSALRQRRNSIVSFISSHTSSGENSRRHSREEKRLSVSSIDSVKDAARSQSTPATSTELRPDSSEGYKPMVSSIPPQLPRLPRLGWHSRSGSSGTDRSKSWGSDDVYEKELVKFAYQVQASTNPSPTKDIILGNVKVNQLAVPNPSKRHSGAWPMARSQTDSELVRLGGQLKVTNPDLRPSTPKRESLEDNAAANGHLVHRGLHSSGSDGRPTSRDSANSPTPNDRRPTDGKHSKPHANHALARHSMSYALATHRDHSLDGSSYVHKQRMYQQQLSIAGWEAEQAVRIANEMALQEEEPEDESEQEFVDATEAVSQPPRRVVPAREQVEAPKQHPGQPKQHSEQPKQHVDQPKQNVAQQKPQVARPQTPETRPKTEDPQPTRKVEKKKDSSQMHRSVPDGLVLKDSRKPATTAPSPTSRDSRINILGFGRRRKSDQERQSTTGKATVSEKKVSRISPPPPPAKDASPPPIPSSPPEKLNSVKAQKAVESKAKAQHHRRSETVEIVQPVAGEEHPKHTAAQSHSRTRTSSSQLLSEDLQLSKPMPRSITTPILTSEMKVPPAIADRGRNESPSKPERKKVTFHRSISSTPPELPKLETAQAKTPEIIVETLSPEGIVRKASIKRPRSNPNLQVTAANAQLPSLDFLPQLKHQPLPKRSPNRSSFMPSPERPLSSQFPAPSTFALKPSPNASAALPLSSTSPNLPSVGSSPLRPESYAGASSSSSAEMSLRPMSYAAARRRSMSPSTHRTSVANSPNVFGRTPTPSESVNAKPVAKLFVICCKCNYWHDLPSHIYEAMCMPKNLTRDPEGHAEGKGKAAAEARLETMVKCPWCEHCMATCMPNTQDNRQPLLEAIQHLRPRGSYDPLPPPGGYPLSAYIKRKFSFAPQLSNISMLSLMPDFASSSMSLGKQVDLSETQEKCSLHFHCIPQGRPETVNAKHRQAAPKKSQEVQSTHFKSGTSERPVISDHFRSNAGSNTSQDTTLEPQIPRSLRRVRGRNYLHAQIASDSGLDVGSDISSIRSNTTSSVPTTPRTSLDSLQDEDSSVALSDNGDAPANACELAADDQEVYQFVKCLVEESPNFFGTFCILNLQLEGKPIQCATVNMLPEYQGPDEFVFLDEAAFGTPYRFQTMPYEGQERQVVPVAGTLVHVDDTSHSASFRWIGLVDLTDFMRGLNEDIWLTVAYEEMDKAGIRRTSGKSKAHPATATSIPSTDRMVEVIQSLHRDYFVIGITDMKKQNWTITLLSPTLSASKEVRRPDFLDIQGIKGQLNIPLEFTTQVKWSMPGLREQLYCIPMSGPKLVCWLCFLVDSELPDLWPSFETVCA